MDLSFKYDRLCEQIDGEKCIRADVYKFKVRLSEPKS